MHDFFYELKNFPSYAKEVDSSERQINKKLKVSEEDGENEYLAKVEYDKLNLSEEIISALTENIFSADDLKKRYGTVISILKSNVIDWKRPIVQLPNLCLTKIDETRFRFDYKDCLITMINRLKIVDEYVDFIQEKNLLYLYGLKGIGKSYIIYQMVAKLMNMDDKYRVIYINETSSDIIKYALDTLKAIVLSDCKNKEFNERLNKYIIDSQTTEFTDYFKLSIIIDDYDIACKIISRCYKFYLNQRIRLLFVFDQTNLILGDPDLKVQLKFLKWIMRNFKTIVSGSANNEIDVLKVTEDVLHSPPIQFTLEEFNIFRNFYSNGLNFITTVEKAEQVLSITGGVALELHRFLKADNVNSLDEMTIEYENDFFNAVIADRYSDKSIGRWFNKLSDNCKTYALENIVRCLFKKSLNIHHYHYYDKRLFTLKMFNKRFYLNSFSCMALGAVLDFYNKYLQVPLINEFQSLMRSTSGYTRSTLGDCVQVFIIQSLCLGILTHSNYRIDFEVDVYGQSVTEKITMKEFEVIRFAGLRVPPTREFENEYKSKLYVPLAENYPGFDLFYYDCEKKSFYCIQITIDENPMEHAIKNDNKVFNYIENKVAEFRPNTGLSKAIDEWIKYLPEGTVFYEIWMVNKNYLDGHIYCERRSERLKHMNFAYFHKMTGLKILAEFFQTKI